jgi:hypothetical protein
MSEREDEQLDAAVDPPENQPGGNMNLNEADESEAAAAVDPPENQPGGSRQ